MADRDSRGRFLQGNIPTGHRQKGSGQPEEFRQMLRERTPAVLAKVIEMAEAGDLKACRLVLERSYPAPTAATIELQEQIEQLRERVEELTNRRLAG